MWVCFDLFEFVYMILTEDIDVHHGDGVQEAFYHTNRVCTLSFHQYDPENAFFPGTGSLEEIGEKEGRFCSINVPLKQGCSDQKFFYLFKTIFDKTIEVYQPEAIWMQCGADSLRGDTIGAFNLSIKGHGKAVQYAMKKGIPIVFNGGGGYNVENVARCWTYESLVITDKTSTDMIIPDKSKYKYEFSDMDLLFTPENKHGILTDYNSEDYTQKILSKIWASMGNINKSVPFLEQINRKGSRHWVDKRMMSEEKEEEKNEVQEIKDDLQQKKKEESGPK
jgi:histone deacetylase 1/2